MIISYCCWILGLWLVFARGLSFEQPNVNAATAAERSKINFGIKSWPLLIAGIVIGTAGWLFV